jgi:hypothetical protein
MLILFKVHKTYSFFAIDEFSSIQQGGGQGLRYFQWSVLDFSLGLKQLAYWLSFIGFTILFGLS